MRFFDVRRGRFILTAPQVASRSWRTGGRPDPGGPALRGGRKSRHTGQAVPVSPVDGVDNADPRPFVRSRQPSCLWTVRGPTRGSSVHCCAESRPDRGGRPGRPRLVHRFSTATPGGRRVVAGLQRPREKPSNIGKNWRSDDLARPLPRPDFHAMRGLFPRFSTGREGGSRTATLAPNLAEPEAYASSRSSSRTPRVRRPSSSLRSPAGRC